MAGAPRLDLPVEQELCTVGTNDFLSVLHELVAFVRVAESGSFSAAAAQLGQTPSAVSRQVSRLEQALGVQLLRRSTRHLSLTEAGVEAFARGHEMVAAAQATLQVAQDHMREPKGQVRISAPKAYARHVLHPCLLRFLEQHPAVDVQLIVSDHHVDPLRDNVDLVVRLTNDPPPGLVVRTLKHVEQWLVASPAYLAGRGPVQHPRDLMAHSCLYLGEQARDNRWRFTRGDEAVEVIASGRYTANHSEIRLDAARAGLGVGCLPDFMARGALDAGEVRRVLPDWRFDAHYQGDACLMFAPSRHTVPKVRVLIDHLVAALSGPPGPAPDRAPTLSTPHAGRDRTPR